MRTSAMAVITAAGLGLALTGCGDGTDGTDASGPSASPTLSSTPTGGTSGSVASCVAGNWRTTTANGQANGGLASAGINGGGGVLVQISPAGEVTIDFSSMQPLTYNAKVADAKVAGTFTYAGKVTGQVRTGEGGASTTTPTAMAPTTMAPAATPGATVTPGATGAPGGDAAGTSGTWEPVPPVNWGDTRLTVDLTQPVKARPFDNVKIADYVGDGAKQSGDVVDIEPLLGEGLYQCQGQTPKDANGIAWTLSRA